MVLWKRGQAGTPGPTAVSGTCPRALGGSQGKFTSSRHCFNGARDLRILVIDNLNGRNRSISGSGKLEPQLPLDKRPCPIELFRCHFRPSLAGDEPLEFFEQGFSYRKVCRLDVVTIL